MLRKLLEIIKRRRFTTPEEQKEFNSDSEKKIRKEVKEKISNEMGENAEALEIEKRKRVEMEILVEILKENPDYYTESEIIKICYEVLA